MHFTELKTETVIVIGPRKVTAEEIVQFARVYDPQWFHTDPQRAQASRWRGLISSGWLTCSIAMEMVVDKILRGSESSGSPGVDELRWPKPLRAGDEVMLAVTVLESSLSRSGNTGIVKWRWQLTNQREEIVLSLLSTSLFDLRSSPNDSQ